MGIEAKDTFIHSRSSFENETRFRTKMAKVYNRFQTESAQKPYPFGLHTLYDLHLLGDLAIDSEAMRARGIIV